MLAACNSDTIEGGVGGLAFEATSTIASPPAQNVQVTVTVTNISSGPVDVQYAACAVTPVFHTGSLDGPVAYDPRPTQACTTASPVTKTLDPGEALMLAGSAAPSPALAAGKYYIEAVIAVNGETVSIGAGTVTY